MPHVNEYLKRVEAVMGKKAPKIKSKAKLQAFLAGMQRTDERLGVAAKWKYWPFEHEAFIPIRRFIEELISPLSAVHVPDQIELVIGESSARP